MLTIYFFYGFAFIILSAIIFLMHSKEDYFRLDKNLVFIGWFAILHGLNEWVDLLIIGGGIPKVEILSITGLVLLSLSFMSLMLFGCVTISGIKKSARWLNVVLILLPLLWIGISIHAKNILVSGIFARYILCVPGAILTCLAMYMSLKRCDVHVTPKSVRIGMWLSMAFFLMYGFLGGVITPDAGFFPASIMNYPNFFNTFHFPVQILRTVCAFVISLGVILLMGVFSGKRPGQMIAGTIKQKLTLIIAASVTLVMFAGSILVYFAGTAMLMNILGREYSQIAHTLNTYMIEYLNNEVEDVRAYATRRLWQDIVSESNLRYEGMSAESIKKRLMDMDEKWIAAKPGDPILKEYLENRVSVGIADTAKSRTKISEIIITDKYGGLVAASDKTSDFYQADEIWWQKAYDYGKGSIYVGDIEFDKSSGNWIIPISAPLKDPKTGEVVGVFRVGVGVERLFGNLANFGLGNTGHAVLVDDKGMTIFHHSISAIGTKVLSEKKLHELAILKRPYVIMNGGELHDRDTFVVLDKVMPPYLSDRGISWVILVVQDVSEISAPIHDFIIQIVMVMILLMILIIPLGALFGKYISDPIHELHLATEKVMAGDWDYKIAVKTGDEIEQFANTFRDMISNIKQKQNELKSFSDGLEIKVEERTKELNTAQEATLNILEDLQASKEALERTNKELVKLDELKSEFISTVSHELRTPLSIIKEGISLVLDKIPGDVNEKQSKILDIAKYNIDRLARIIDDLLDISKIEAGKVELKRRLINISDVVRQVANSFELKIKDKGLEMHLDIDNIAEKVWVDTDRITQVLTNLLGNAIKFTNSGHIDISCKDKNDSVICSIADTGMGISKDDLPKVFNKFQQFGRLAGAGEKGTGLGLSIAKHIIDMHNGVIWLESEAGKGSKFIFKLHKYTPQSLFSEHVSRVINLAADKSARMSIIMMSSNLAGKDVPEAIKGKFDDMMRESAKMIKNTLKNEKDDIINNGNETIVILADCDREGVVKVQYRIEEIVGKYLAEKGADGVIKTSYGYATYPDDAKNETGLIDKARAALVLSAKA